eukprot:7391953-Pyramimonas_sp.AAC.1
MTAQPEEGVGGPPAAAAAPHASGDDARLLQRDLLPLPRLAPQCRARRQAGLSRGVRQRLAETD